MERVAVLYVTSPEWGGEQRKLRRPAVTVKDPVDSGIARARRFAKAWGVIKTGVPLEPEELYDLRMAGVLVKKGRK